jgi:non-lysosomal glucosylceramidase
VITREKSRSALKSLWKYNFTPDVGPFRAVETGGRWYAMAGDGGMFMLSHPFVPKREFDGPPGCGPRFISTSA